MGLFNARGWGLTVSKGYPAAFRPPGLERTSADDKEACLEDEMGWAPKKIEAPSGSQGICRGMEF